MFDTVGEHHIGLRIVRTQCQYRLVGGRIVPAMHVLPVGKFDDDQVARPVVLDHLHIAAMNQKTAAERFQRGIDLVQMFDDPRTHRGMAHMGNGVGGHDCTPLSSKPSCRPRKGNLTKRRARSDYV
jgi:hypothetical protein